MGTQDDGPTDGNIGWSALNYNFSGVEQLQRIRRLQLSAWATKSYIMQQIEEFAGI